MPQCPLCKTRYSDGVAVCKIDGTALDGASRTASVALSAVEPAPGSEQGLSESDLHSVLVAGSPPAEKAVGKGRLGLGSMTDEEVTAAANPDSLARRSGQPQLATGSGTAAPKNKKKDSWAAPFVDYREEESKPEDWIGRNLGSYELKAILGKGGMGCVYQAEHTKLGREVALKVLRSEYASRKDSVARFFQEARAVNKVRHRNIVDITDLVELDSNIVFIIMEFLDGRSLTSLMRSVHEVDTTRTLGLLVQICDGLAAAHSVGIVHRDLKPDNIIVCEDDSGKDLIKLLDFGVAKLLDKDEDDDIGLQTVAGSVVGTPAYMSPEQAGGEQVDGRADIYSMGAIMYEMFTKQPLFRGKSFGEYVRLHLTEIPTRPSLTAGGKDIDPAIEEAIMMCLEKNPDARFQTAKELRAELLSLLAASETSGELTAHLVNLGQSAAQPVGAALPAMRAVQPDSYPPGPQSGAPAATPGYYPDSGFPVHQQDQVMANHHAQDMRQPGQGMPSQSNPLLPTPVSPSGAIPPHGYGPGTPVGPQPGYGSDVSHGFATGPMGNSSVHVEPGRSYLGIGVGIALGLMAVLAFVVFGSSSGSGSASSGQSESGPSAEAATSSDSVASTTDEKSSETTGASDVKSSAVAPTVEPIVEPIEEPPATEPSPPEPRSVIVVRMSSEPSGEIFKVGVDEPLCTTPCEIKIDTAETVEGESPRGDYFVRHKGFLDRNITINLRAPREEVFVSLVPKRKKRTARDSKVSSRPKNRNTSDHKPKRKHTRDSDKDADKDSDKPKCKASAQDTFNPFGDSTPCK